MPMVIVASLFMATEVNAQNTGTRRSGKTEKPARDIKKEIDVFMENAVEDIKTGKKTKEFVSQEFHRQFPRRYFSDKATNPLGSEADYKSFSERFNVVLKETPSPSGNQSSSVGNVDETATDSSKGENSRGGFSAKHPVLYGVFEFRGPYP